MGGGALVAVVALSLVAVWVPVGVWLRRRPAYRSIPRPTQWLMDDADALSRQELHALTRAQRNVVAKAVSRGTAVSDPALALAAYRSARASSARERDQLTRYPRGIFFPAFMFIAMFCPGLITGQGRVFGQTGVVDSVLVLLFAAVLAAEAVRSTRSLRRSELAEELNSELIPAEVVPERHRKRGRFSSGGHGHPEVAGGKPSLAGDHTGSATRASPSA